MTQTTETTKTIQMIPTKRIRPHPENPRRELAEYRALGTVEELKARLTRPLPEKLCHGYMSHINRFNASGYPDPTAYEALTRVEQELHDSRFRPIVYICSPFSGDTETNLENARRYSRFAVDQGYLPITPHLLFPQFMDDSNEAERNLAMRMNIILLTKCAELWAFGDRISKGMSIEIARARRKGQTVRFFTDDCKEVN